MHLVLEIIIPLRNPGPVLVQTLESLVNQTDRGFSVTISDNHSTDGREIIEEAVTLLQEVGIPFQLLQPPVALDRVEHWNWLHYQAAAAWIKPLFAGDTLEPDYVETVRSEILRNPGCQYIYSGYNFHQHAENRVVPVVGHWSGGFRTAEEMHDVVVRYGHQFGPPSCAAYTRDAFIAVGGYRTGLPICADSLFFCALARRFGAIGIPRVMTNFHIHASRFSTTLPGRQKAVLSEKITYLTSLLYHAWTEKNGAPIGAMLRMIFREWRGQLRRA